MGGRGRQEWLPLTLIYIDLGYYTGISDLACSTISITFPIVGLAEGLGCSIIETRA
jgi:hypothetical protein